MAIGAASGRRRDGARPRSCRGGAHRRRAQRTGAARRGRQRARRRLGAGGAGHPGQQRRRPRRNARPSPGCANARRRSSWAARARAVRPGVVEHGAPPARRRPAGRGSRGPRRRLPASAGRSLAEHGHAERQRLGERQAVAFGEAGEEQGAGAGAAGTATAASSGRVPSSRTRPRSAAQRSSRSRTFSFSQPRRPMSSRRGAACAESRREVAPEMQQQQVVLAGLDGAEADEIGLGRRGRRRGRAPRRGCRAARRRSAAAAGRAARDGPAAPRRSRRS